MGRFIRMTILGRTRVKATHLVYVGLLFTPVGVNYPTVLSLTVNHQTHYHTDHLHNPKPYNKTYTFASVFIIFNVFYIFLNEYVSHRSPWLRSCSYTPSSEGHFCKYYSKCLIKPQIYPSVKSQLTPDLCNVKSLRQAKVEGTEASQDLLQGVWRNEEAEPEGTALWGNATFSVCQFICLT